MSVCTPNSGEQELWDAPSARQWSQRILSSGQCPSSTSLVPALQHLLRGSVEAPPLRISSLEALLISAALYRIRWDANKQLIVFDERAAIDGLAANALQGLSRAASQRASPLGTEVQLLELFSRLHFGGPPLFFHRVCTVQHTSVCAWATVLSANFFIPRSSTRPLGAQGWRRAVAGMPSPGCRTGCGEATTRARCVAW